ncbi:MAG: hypothetical protein ACP5N0_06570 [Methanosarcina sp.]|jgi:hypothetical protein
MKNEDCWNCSEMKKKLPGICPEVYLINVEENEKGFQEGVSGVICSY